MSPADLAIENFSLTDRHGHRLKGWLIAGEERRGAVLLLHGINASRRSLLRRARFLSKAGYSIVMIDLQAHGESDGERITFGYLEAAGVSAAVKFARRRWPKKRLAIIGLSLGGASAIMAGGSNAADAYILEAVFPNLRAATVNRFRIKLGAAGALIAPLFLLQVPLRLGIAADELAPAARIRQIHAPVFIIAGGRDRRTTLQNSQALYENANQPKSIWVLPGAAHQDFYRFSASEYKRRVLAFLAVQL